VVVAKQEITKRASRCNVTAGQSAVQNQHAVRVQENRVKAQAGTVYRAINYIYIFGSESLIFTIPQAVVNNSVCLGIPKTASQPRAGTFNRRQLGP
jgi:hypothetical protein